MPRRYTGNRGRTLSYLTGWRRETKKYGPNSFHGKGNPKSTDEQREIAELKKKAKLRDYIQIVNEKGEGTVGIYELIKQMDGQLRT